MCHCAHVEEPAFTLWRPEDKKRPTPLRSGSSEVYRPDILETIEAKIKELSKELRTVSLDIHAHPELGFEEFYAHDVYTEFMAQHGFEVTKHFHLPTAWQATFTHGVSGRTVGINSEMDALPGIGHACGHNLIGISGVAVACAIKAALEKHDISGKIILLGTPGMASFAVAHSTNLLESESTAEESGHGKVKLLDCGAYEEMDVCLMCHPSPGPIGSVSLTSCLALKEIEVEYKGRNAHAALSPWEGRNALDAAVLAYNNISALRQQLKPTHRVQGIFEGKDWAPNIIPDHSKFSCLIRAPTREEMEETAKRVVPCFEAAALATGCEVTITFPGAVYDVRQNRALGDNVANIVLNKYGSIDYKYGIASASTDFGNVTYALPSLHPGFAIPTEVNGGNHTPAFARAAATIEAHNACLDVSKALAATGVRVLADDEFFAKVQKTFKEDEILRRPL
ncbi:uncharacterized protein LACBIDRAFT_317213 [Laccaria bicolor S238N-H82]|uniref:Peptidase M20 domain-containing protein 2 n=1 Tax=Laccaria bicolor (strain S238N-H82 / ATCC MYA-4686) TaxID=486041 RepID=B0D4P0_LACBS|nr:uncharacterized protein LACBIDRAFT_317213 [Laccaria bicolor S238N-H82]EDR10597.1 predicted protein [Laccaria bicolor S238N-H82]|eukprot:XP_001879047.1 predicted protein [Laccaria bicolor S238N-H82]